MPVVRINDATFANISTLKLWFKTKSPSETIDCIVREAMERIGIEQDDEIVGAAVVTVDGVRVYDEAPSLTFTKPVKATIEGISIMKPSWTSILQLMISRVKVRGYEGEELVRMLGIPCKAIQFERDGYKFLPKLGISVQGQSAAEIWKEVDRISKAWRISANVEFVWRQNPKARHPGKMGILRVGPFS